MRYVREAGWVLVGLIAVVAAGGCGGTDRTAPGNTAGVAPPGPAAGSVTKPRSLRAAEFNLPGVDGPAVSLSSLRGRVVLLDFWGTWCIPCRQELPDIEKLYSKFGKAGFVVVGMTESSTKPDVVAVRKALHLTFPLVMADDAAARAYHAGADLPVAVLVDRKGEIAGRLAGVDPQKPVIGYWTPLIQKALRS